MIILFVKHMDESLTHEKFSVLSQKSEFVSSMKALFEQLWENAMPGKEKIRQIEGKIRSLAKWKIAIFKKSFLKKLNSSPPRRPESPESEEPESDEPESEEPESDEPESPDPASEEPES